MKPWSYLEPGQSGITNKNTHLFLQDFMYLKGQLKLGEKDEYPVFDRHAYLPHSCDEWEIGPKQNIQWLIEDLQEIMNKL